MRLTACVLLLCCASGAVLSDDLRAPFGRKSVVLVANGSADCDVFSDNVAKAVAAVGAPVHVIRICWGTEGVGFNIGDQETHHRASARLAARIAFLRQRNCYDKICLLGFSGGTVIVLEAAERLPPGSIDRIVLLGSGVSSRHDLSRALLATRDGIDNFYSDYDVLLTTFVDLFGTNDKLPAPAAGNIGFRAPCVRATPPLRQYPWTEAMDCSSGHQGNHLGYVRAAFLRNYVVPLLAP